MTNQTLMTQCQKKKRSSVLDFGLAEARTLKRFSLAAGATRFDAT